MTEELEHILLQLTEPDNAVIQQVTIKNFCGTYSEYLINITSV